MTGRNVFIGNTAYVRGEAVSAHESVLMIKSTTSFICNTAIDHTGGAVYSYRSRLHITETVQFSNNSGGLHVQGGALFLSNSTAVLKGNITFDSNSAYASGAVSAHE